MEKNRQNMQLHNKSSGGTLMGFVLGLLLGLAKAVGVAVVLKKGAPEPKLNLRAPESANKPVAVEAIEEGEIQVEDRPNLNRAIQSKVPLSSESAKKDPIANNNKPAIIPILYPHRFIMKPAGIAMIK
jgi:hypothetical protein